jgi:hypothetical protein
MSAPEEVITVRVGELRQFFDSIDPAPFRERDLDAKVEQFVVEWAREVPRDVLLTLRVCIDSAAAAGIDDRVVSDAVHQYFAYRATSTRRQLKHLFGVGRVSLLIGLVALVGLTGLSQLVAHRLSSGFGEILREGLSIGGWVAMWRPIEIFLYDWWPIRREAQLYDRLSTMPVNVEWDSSTQAAPDV